MALGLKVTVSREGAAAHCTSSLLLLLIDFVNFSEASGVDALFRCIFPHRAQSVLTRIY